MIDRSEKHNRSFINHKKVFIVSSYLMLVGLTLTFPLIKKYFFPEKTSLNLVIFSEMFNEDIFADFTEQTGIQLNIKYLDSDDDLMVQIKDESLSYDVASISDYFIPQLSGKYLVPLDQSKLSNYHNIHSYFTKGQEHVTRYGVPFAWNFYGICYDKNVLKLPEKISWKTLFKPDKYHVCMQDDARVLASLASIFLFGTTTKLKAPHYQQIRDLLVNQKADVELYTDTNILHLFLYKVIPLALVSYGSSLLLKDTAPHLKFVIPTEGTLRIFHHLTIPKSCTNQEAAYKFINFMLSHEVAHANKKETGFLSTHKDLFAESPLPQSILDSHKIYDAITSFSSRQFADLWITLKNS